MTGNVDINPKLSFYLAHLFVPSRTNQSITSETILRGDGSGGEGGGGRVHQCLKDALHRLKRLFKAPRVKTVM